MKELVINADDFGLSEGANAAIMKAYGEGILTGTSLMVGGTAFRHAVSLALSSPGLQVGLHLTLVHGCSVLPHEEIPGLVDANGYFSTNAVSAGMRYFFLPSLKKQLHREIEAQILKFKATGIPLSHVDGHLNIHMHPVVFDILVELMPKHDITSFRLTRERISRSRLADRRRLLGKIADGVIFSALARRCRPRLRRLGVRHAGEVMGLLNSGKMTEDYVLGLLEDLRENLNEIYFHPGYQCETLRRLMPDYLHEQELRALTSPTVKRKLASLDIILRNYRGEEKVNA